MIQEYYIVTDKGRTGPYDLVAIVRKIRNSSLTADMLMQKGDSESPQPASQWPELAGFFLEKKEERPAAHDNSKPHNRTLLAVLKSGWIFLQRNHYTTVYSGLLILIVILLAYSMTVYLPPTLRIVSLIVCFMVGYFLFCCYSLTVLRMARGQPVDSIYIQNKLGASFKSLFIFVIIASIPSIIGLSLLTANFSPVIMLFGLFIFAVPGLFTFTLFAFTPLLILDRGTGVFESMEISRKSILGAGLENAGIFYALFVINFLAGLCILLPMAITLPITIGALAEIYDENFG